MESTSSDTTVLPEDPGANLSLGLGPAHNPQIAAGSPATVSPIASKYSMVISAGFQAPAWTAHDKFIGGLRDVVSPISLAGDIFSAGYSHVTNGQPNYGTNGEALGKRVGATFARDSAETFLAESVMPVILHEDPRYYVEGPQYNFFHRTLYAITRPIITRTDSGHATLNGALLIGYAGACGLDYAYYPQINTNFKDTASTFGGSIGGAAIGDVVVEFVDDLFHHHK